MVDARGSAVAIVLAVVGALMLFAAGGVSVSPPLLSSPGVVPNEVVQVRSGGLAQRRSGEIEPDPTIFDDEDESKVPRGLDARFYGKRGTVRRRLIPDLYLKKWQGAGCPDERWWAPVLAAKTPRPEDNGRNVLRYAEVGVNKGYRLIWLIETISGLKEQYGAKALWNALLQKNAPTLRKGQSTYNIRYMTKNLCGFCCDCNEESFRDEKGVAGNTSFLLQLDSIQLEAHAFDMNGANIEFLKDFTDQRQHKNVHVTYHHAAVGNRDGTIDSCKAAFAKESFGIDTQCSAEDRIKIPAVRLDDVLRNSAGGFDFMDFVLVDVEGYDVPVLQGARKIIEQRKVGIVMFELHGVDNFNAVYLDLFETNDYTCFLTTQGIHGRHRKMRMPYLVQTNFGFQHTAYRRGKYWGNAICHQNIAPYVAIFASLKDQLWPTSDLKCHYLGHRERELKKVLV
jgi:FkbM family methyltransferase